MMETFNNVNVLETMAAFDEDERGKLFVGGLSWDTTHYTLLNYFGKFGEVIDCVVMKNQQTGKSRGFGFVRFKNPEIVDVVLMTGPHIIDGRQVDPKNCNPRRLNQVGGKSAENSKKKIFIGGLPATCDEAQLKEVFRKYGPVEDATIMYDQEKNRSRGFGFLTFENEVAVDKVCSEHFIYINGKQVECKRAEPRQVKSMADTGSPIILHPGPQGMLIGMASPGASGISHNLSQGSLNGSSPQQLPSPVGAAMQHPSGLIAAPGMMVPYPTAFGGPPYYCIDQTLQFHHPLGAHAMPGHMIGVLPGSGGVAAAAAAGMSGPSPQQSGIANPAMQGGVAFTPANGDSVPKNMQVCAAADGFSSVRQVNVSGAESASAAQISFQPQVTYTLAPGIPPVPGFGPIYPGGPSAMQAAGDASGGPQYLQQFQPSIGRIPSNHASAFLPHFHPYRR